MNVGEKIRFYRKNNGLRQKELGEMVGLTGVAIMRYEKGQREPNQSTIEKLAQALKISPLELLPFDKEIVFDLSKVSTADLLEEIAKRCK